MKSLNIHILEDRFSQLERNLKDSISKSSQSALSTQVTKLIANKIYETSLMCLESVYMASVAIFVENVFDIYFSDRSFKNKKWNQFSYSNGYIGQCCSETLKTGIPVHILNGKVEMAMENRLTQKSLFVGDSNMHAFFVAPVTMSGKIIGSLQLSFSKRLADEERDSAKFFLQWHAEKIIWILFSEQTKHNAILSVAKAMGKSLDIKNEYQADHSSNVEKLATHFTKEIVSDENYINNIFGSKRNFRGFSSLKIRLAALLHDMGKLVMADDSYGNIRTIDDYAKRMLHPYFTEIVLGTVDVTKDISKISAFHHERPDGKGYPFGIKISEKMIEVQLIKLADTLDSMARERSQKQERTSFSEIIKQIHSDRFSSLFSESFYNVFLSIIESYKIKSNHSRIPRDIRILLGLEKAKTQRNKIDANHLPVLRRILESDRDSLTNRWVAIFCFKVKDQSTVPIYDGAEINIKAPIFTDGKRHFYSSYNFDGDSDIRLFVEEISSEERKYIGAFLLPQSFSRTISYPLCEDISKFDFIQSMSVAFCNYELLSSARIIRKIKKTLTEELQRINDRQRWRLIELSNVY